MTRTTTYLVSLLLAFAVSPVGAQVSLFRIGILGAPEEPRFTEIVAGLTRGLRELGYTDKTIEIVEGRVPRGDNASERAVVEKMVQQRIKVLFAIGSRLVSQARQVSADLPIIFITPGDPVASGLVASLARPGGNTTGMTFEYPELSGKRLELLKEMAPRVRRVLAIYDPRDDSPKQSIAAAREVAPKLGLTLIERQSRKRPVDRLGEIFAVQRVLLVRTVVEAPEKLGGHNVRRAAPTECLERSAHDPLRLTFRVHLGVVEEVDARVVRGGHALARDLRVELISVRHPGAQRERTYLEAGAPEPAIDHRHRSEFSRLIRSKSGEERP